MIKIKKIIGITLAASMMLTCLFPIQAAAGPTEQEIINLKIAAGEIPQGTNIEVTDQKLKATILEVKQKFGIADSFDKFDYSVNSDSKVTKWNFNWQSSKVEDTISIVYGSDGNTYNYYINFQKENRDRKTLNKITKDKALQSATEFLKIALPTEYINFKQIEDNSTNDYGLYQLNFQYYEQNVPVDGSIAMVGVDAQNGRISNYNSYFDIGTDFPTVDGVIGIEKAKDAYSKNIGLKLIFQSKISYKDNQPKIESIFPVYVPKYSYDYAIDAKTGEKILISQPYIDKRYAGMKNGTRAESADTSAYLSPSEESAVKDVAGIIPKEKAVNDVMGKGIPNLNKDMKLISADLNKSTLYSKSGYIWNLYFSLNNKDNMLDNMNISIDAKTEEVISFSTGRRLYDSGKGEYKLEDVRKEAAAFLKTFVPDKFAKTTLDESQAGYEIYGQDMGRFISVNYVRVENGVEFPENSLNVTFDTLDKIVASYYCNWYEASFPSVEGVVSKDVILDKIFAENPLELIYRVSGTSTENRKVNLVYQPKQDNKQLLFDAFSGKRLNYDGEQADVVDKIGEYKDIDNNFAKQQIEELSNIGIGFYGNEFRPTQQINQKELMYLISQTFTYSIVPQKPIEKFSAEEITAMYNELKRRNIIKENEKAPENGITRAEAVKYLVRVLGIGTGEIAEHGEIYISDFIDFNTISTEYKGYVAIAKALGIAWGNEGSFNANDAITRDETAVMIYRLLDTKN